MPTAKQKAKPATGLVNAFLDKASQPTAADLAAALGRARTPWDRLLAALADEYKLVGEWHSYSRKAGWSLRLKKKDRNIVYLSPCRGCFLASFALGEKAVAAALGSGLPPTVVQIIRTATKYAEGTAVRIPVTTAGDLPAVQELVRIKLEN